MRRVRPTPQKGIDMKKTPFYKNLYIQVLFGIACGVVLGYVSPEWGTAMRPLGDGFVKLIRMLIAPIVFVTVVLGIAQTGAMKEVGRIGLRALIYFEVVSTLALVIGLVVVSVLKPGSGLTIDPGSLDMKTLASYTTASKSLTVTDFLLNIIPTTFVNAFAQGEILQVLLIAVLFGMALLIVGEAVALLVSVLSQVSKALFGVVAIVMRAAPIGAFGAMAFTVGRFGLGSLLVLGKLMAGVYATCLLFIFVVLGGIAAATGFSLLKFLAYIREEIFIVVGTSSSESVLPRMMEKLERLGCPKSVVGLVIPTGYSFNLDGTSIYMTMAAMFVAQVSGVHLSLGQELSMLAILLLTSKGAAAVTGSGFITLAATLSAFPMIPVAGLALLLGVDRFMSEARALTNLIGNGVATMAIARWEGTLDLAMARARLSGHTAWTPPIPEPLGVQVVTAEGNAADPRQLATHLAGAREL
jgi:aerobic C4-dicarboxylate transport protein